MTGWGGLYSAGSRVARVLDGYDGLYSLRVSNASAATGSVGFIDKPRWLTSSRAGTSYRGSIWVKAGVAGQKFTLYLRELTPSGIGVAGQASTYQAPDSGWHQLTAQYPARSSGDAIAFYAYASGVASKQWFEADAMSLTSSAL
jgi:hypothetical protein